MCCDHCHRPIQPGAARTWLDGVKHWVWVCSTCFAFLLSAGAQSTPPERPAPVLMYFASPIVAASTNTSSGMISAIVGADHNP